jgi:hypothetical protein
MPEYLSQRNALSGRLVDEAGICTPVGNGACTCPCASAMSQLKPQRHGLRLGNAQTWGGYWLIHASPAGVDVP